MAPVIPPEAVALFAKASVPGNVKTRLQPPLNPVEAADLHLAFAADAWSKIKHLAPAATYLYSDTGAATYSDWAGVQARLQRGDHLGERMAACFLELQQAGHQRILIVGSDIPSLPLGYLQLGLTMLQDCDAVLGPVDDGGYYAVGCRRPLPEMFDGVTWSSGDTREQTEAVFLRLGYSIQLLPSWYDVDTFEDLQRLAGDPNLPPRTRAWLDQHAHLFPVLADNQQQAARTAHRS
jgi:rSAM/selenodomain-associated transferase 1